MSGIDLPTDPQELAELVGRSMYARDKASQGLGIRLLQIRPGYARLAMRVRADMVNHHGTCQGGFIFILADSAFAFSCNAYNRSAVAAACTIDFVTPAQLGDLLSAETVEKSLVKRNGVYDVTVSNQDNRCIALFRGKSLRSDAPVI